MRVKSILILALLFALILHSASFNSAFALYGNFSYSSSSPSNKSTTVSADLETVKLTFLRNVAIRDQKLFNETVLTDGNGNPVQGTLSISGKQLLFQIEEGLKQDTEYTFTVPAGALMYEEDEDCINSLIIIKFTTIKYYFSYSSSVPKNGSTGVDTNLQYVNITFSKPVEVNDEELFDGISVVDPAGNPVSGGFFIVNNILQAKINQALTGGVSYSITVPKGALKYAEDKNYINKEISIMFTAEGDTERPYVVWPSGTSLGVLDPSAPISIKFSEPVRLTDKKSSITLKDKSGGAVPIKISISGSDVLSVTPGKALKAKTQYTLCIPSDSVVDLYMNSPSKSYTFTFTAGVDNKPPYIVFQSIRDGETEVPYGLDEIEIVFSEKIKYGSAYSDILLKSASGEIISIKKTISDDILTINVLSQLEPATEYTLSLPEGAVSDYDGNCFDEDVIFSFTTVAEGTTLYIKNFTALDLVYVNAGTEFETVASSILPGYVNVTLSDNSKRQMAVRWISSTPEYDMAKPGKYTIKGKIILSGNIINSKKIIPSVNIEVIDSEHPYWTDEYFKADSITSSSARLLWKEAVDDSYIKEYIIEIKQSGVVKKTVKVKSSGASRLSDDEGSSNYSILFTNVGGLSANTRYEAYLTAYDSEGNSTETLKTTFTTDEKAATTKTSRDTNNSDNSKDYTNILKFKDLEPYKWAEDAIYSLVEKGVVAGTSNTTFSPGDNVTRADLTVLIVRAFGFDSAFDSVFADVPKSAYYYRSIGVAKDLGLARGREDPSTGELKFYPGEYIKREDMFVMIKRALDYSGFRLNERGTKAGNFNDYYMVSDYARDAVSALVGAGVVKGDGKLLNPKGYATRAEVAVLLDRILDELQ